MASNAEYVIKGTSDKEEESAIKNNCEHVRNFLKLLSLRGSEGLSSESQLILEGVEKEMAEYLEKKKEIKEENNIQARENAGECEPLKRDTMTAASTSKIRKVSDKKNVTTQSSDLGSSSDTASSTISTTDSYSSREEKPKRPKKKQQRKVETPTTTTETDLITLLQRIDNRSIPKQEPYREDSGQDFQHYLTRFEEYCKDNFRGRKYLWIPELERHLTGRILEGFHSLRDYDDSYEEMKDKLIRWYKDSKHTRRSKAHKKFENARMKPRESLYLFATRLESLFKSAFPTHRIQKSKTLSNQFIDNIPKSIKQDINSQILTYKIKNKKVTWAFMLKCARLKDVDWEHQKRQDSEEEKPEEVLVHLGTAEPPTASHKRLFNAGYQCNGGKAPSKSNSMAHGSSRSRQQLKILVKITYSQKARQLKNIFMARQHKAK